MGIKEGGTTLSTVLGGQGRRYPAPPRPSHVSTHCGGAVASLISPKATLPQLIEYIETGYRGFLHLEHF